MSTRVLGIALGFFVSMGFLVSCSSSHKVRDDQRSSDQRPNILLVMTDDQGYGDVGVLGNPIIQTPNIDAFHGESVRLTNYHVDPTCSPTRAALMTGQYSMRARVWHTIMGRSLLPTEKKTMAERLQEAGYRTGIFGKWHLGDNSPYTPEDQGFSHVVIHGGGGVGQTPDYWGNTQFDDTYYVNGVPTAFKGNSTDVWFDEAEKFLNSSDDEPVFAYVSLNSPHSPWRAPAQYVEPYTAQGLPHLMANFYAMITHLDERFGRIRNLVKTVKNGRPTIVVFTTDNGSAFKTSARRTDGRSIEMQALLEDNASNGWKINAGMRGYKSSVYEGGHRVPFFISVPGVEDGKDVSVMAAHFDVLPTLLDLANIPITDLDIDGVSLAPVVTGDKANMPPRTLVVTNQRVFTPSFDRPMSVMNGPWRYIQHGEKGIKELYNISTDPSQSNNVMAENPEMASKLETFLIQWWATYGVETAPNLIPIGATNKDVRLTGMDWMEAPSTGAVPWWPSHPYLSSELEGYGWIGREDKFKPLPWYIDVVKGEEFTFTLRVEDMPSQTAIGLKYAHIRVGDAVKTVEINPDDKQAVINLSVPSGFQKMTAYFSDQEKANSGRPAFFVYAKPKT